MPSTEVAVELRPATGEEREHLLALIRGDAATYLGAGLDLLGFSWEQLHDALASVGRTVVGTVDGEVVVTLWLDLRGDVLHVHAVVVEPAWRGLGMGPGALRAVARQERERARVVELGVHVGNDPARRLYDALGFTVVSTRPEAGFEIRQCPVERLAASR